MSPARSRRVGAIAAGSVLAAIGMWDPSSVARTSDAAGGSPPQGAGPTPAVTLLYQNFPNPFPSPESRTTCIWFDLAQPSSVSLTIHDVRGHLVRRMLPRPGQAPTLVPGRYGRAVPSTGLACNPAFVWDGRADDGTVVARGVYLIRLRAGGTQSIKKAVFQGP